MEYNTAQKKLILPEYGRHVHLMVQHAIKIKDRDQRNIAANTIVGIMGILMPHLREVPDFKRKLWDHLFIISEFKLDIDAPYPPPSPGKLQEKPQTVPYPQVHIRQKHYGKILVNMIRETAKISDPQRRDPLIQMLSAQMRKSYSAWNHSELSNEQIAQDIWDISDDKIVLDPSMIQFAEPIRRPEQTNQRPVSKSGRKRIANSNWK
jgi:hypothetical protein